MPSELADLDKQQAVELVPDRHELVERVAYQLWEKRGRPSGSPGIDWVAA